MIQEKLPSQPENVGPSEPAAEPAAVKEQLDKIVSTRFFRTSPRLKRFLCYTVECALKNRADLLKEYCIALEVFSKPETFDPRIDSAVRVAARQLRAKIDAYYLTDGSRDEVLIRFRPGDYVPRFYLRHSGGSMCDGAGDVSSAPAIIADKEWSTVREVTAALDAFAYPLSGVVDSGEKALEAAESLPGSIVIAGLSLTGGMTGIDLVRALKDHAGRAIIAVAPVGLGGDLLSDLVASNPDAVLFKPVRQSDVSGAIRVALARRALRQQGIQKEVSTSN